MYDVIIIGCGVVGAAAAYALAKRDVRVLVLEAENDVAAKSTKANSAILHAGFDPECGTKMARLNVAGVKMAKEICEALDVPYQQCGSLVMAFSEEETRTLDKLYRRGLENGVPDLSVLTAEQVHEMEPEASPSVVAALWAPGAAIVSPWEYALAMAECAVVNGVELHRNETVIGLEKKADIWQVVSQKANYDCRFVINAAGLESETIHNMVAPPSFSIKPTRGQYYLLDKSEGSRVRHVVFPCPSAAGKGVLVTPTVHGNCLVGPSAEPVEGDDTATTAEGLRGVAEAARRNVPQVDLRSVIRVFSGVRANTDRDDFIIEFATPGVLDLAGIKSPGLSAAAAIGEEAVSLLREAGLHAEYKTDFVNYRRRIRFQSLSAPEKNELIQKKPAYGRIVCRCESITEGEILASLDTPIPPRSVDGVKRRCGAGMGRCQGGFCGPKVLEILSRELCLSATAIEKDKSGSFIILGETKQEDRC